MRIENTSEIIILIAWRETFLTTSPGTNLDDSARFDKYSSVATRSDSKNSSDVMVNVLAPFQPQRGKRDRNLRHA